MHSKQVSVREEPAAEVLQNRHPTVFLEYGDQSAHVDKGIASLIFEMWRAGITTYQSCQGNPPGWIWLQFASSDEVQRFLNIVSLPEGEKGPLYDRMTYGYGPSFRRKGQWRYKPVVFDLEDDAEGEFEEDDWQGPLFQMLIAIHFPESDLPEVLRRLVAFNSNRP
jgi:hypothetical protein